MNERVCQNCSHYRCGFCKKIPYSQKQVDPSDTCENIEVDMVAAIKNRLCLLPEWKAWAIPRFTICFLVALGICIALTAFVIAICAIGALLSGNVPSAIILLFLATIICFLVWCCIALIRFIVEELLE